MCVYIPRNKIYALKQEQKSCSNNKAKRKF